MSERKCLFNPSERQKNVIVMGEWGGGGIVCLDDRTRHAIWNVYDPGRTNQVGQVISLRLD